MDPHGTYLAVKTMLCKSDRGASKKLPGFTLIELLIAAALGVLVVAAVVAAFTGGIRVWERARGGSSPALDAALAIEWLQRDIHNSTATRLASFEGALNWMHIPVLTTVTGASGSQVLEGVNYDAPAGRGTLERSVGDRSGGGGVAAAGEALIVGLESVRFSYRDGAEGDWLTAWTSRTNRPAAVGVVLQFTQDRGGLEIRRTILVPGS